MLVNGLLSLIWGWLCQQTEPFVDMVVSVETGWNKIVKYTIGVFFIFPMFLWTLYKLLCEFCPWSDSKQRRDILNLAGISYFTAALGIGTGVVAGHMMKK